MATLIFIGIVFGILLIGQFSWIGWAVGLVGLLLFVHIPPIKTNFLWWWGRFWTDNNTRLRTWWMINILLFAALLACTGQALGQIDNRCVPGKNFATAEGRNNFISRGGILCEARVSRAWFSPKTLGMWWGIFGLSVVGGIGYVPIALSDELARAKERRRTRVATQQGQPTAPVATTNGRSRGRFLEGLAAAGIMDVIVGAIIHDGRE
ncbi:MAG: hypothetical protein HY617_03480 [Candidatus Sungbacteria bacterium]|nr:hypothetical protein [Candidatus Sungbacteria bacterium]